MPNTSEEFKVLNGATDKILKTDPAKVKAEKPAKPSSVAKLGTCI